MKSILYIAILSLSLVGCADIYSPSTPNITNFNKKYEFHGEVVASLNGFNFKSAFSPLDHVCLQINGRSSGSNQGTEIAFGVYNFLTSASYNQLTFGYGTGKFNYSDPMSGSDFSLTKASGEYKKMYGQFHFTFDKNEESLQGFCIRLEKVKVSYSYANIDDINGNTYDVLYFEPFYTGQFELSKHFNFSIYAGVNLKSQSNVIKTNGLNLGAGFVVKLFNKSVEN